jgi:hypothetical protein
VANYVCRAPPLIQAAVRDSEVVWSTGLVTDQERLLKNRRGAFIPRPREKAPYMQNNKAVAPTTSSKKRKLGFAPIRRGLLEHLPVMSSNAVKLYLWFHLKAYWSGPRRGYVEASFDDMAHGNGWSYNMVRRTVEELIRKGYIEVACAANQYQLTAIEILNFDLEESDSAVSTDEHTKPANNSAVSSGALNAVSTGERSSEHSKPGNAQSNQELEASKKAKKVKEVKNAGNRDAVRRPFDAGLRTVSERFSPKKRRENLESRITEKGFKNETFFNEDLDEDQRAAFAATGYTPRDPQTLSDGFVNAVEVIWGKYKGTDISPGILCTKIIDCCMREQESNKKLGVPESDYYWPPDFGDYRNRLRDQERAHEKSNGVRV